MYIENLSMSYQLARRIKSHVANISKYTHKHNLLTCRIEKTFTVKNKFSS